MNVLYRAALRFRISISIILLISISSSCSVRWIYIFAWFAYMGLIVVNILIITLILLHIARPELFPPNIKFIINA